MIEIISVKFRNFKSFGNQFSEFNFKNPGMNMIIGENLDIPDSSNGSGKSTLTDTIVYSIYGKSIENLKDNDLINNINGKNLEIELVFKKNSKYYKIYRYRKTKDGNGVKFYESTKNEFNEENDISKDSIANTNNQIQEVIGISYELFIRVACFSANHIPFFELSARSGNQNQSSIIEELFELLELAENAELLKAKTKENTQKLQIAETKLSQQEQEQKRHKSQIESTKNRIETWEQNKFKSIKSYKEILENIKNIDFDTELHNHENHQKLNNEIKIKNNNIKTEKSELSNILKTKNELETNIKSLKEGECPFCHQSYNNDSTIKKLEYELKNIFQIIESKKSILTVLLEEIDDLQNEYNNIDMIYDSYELARDLANKQKTISDKIQDLDEEINPHIESLKELEDIKFEELGYEKINQLNKLIEHEKFLYKLLTNKNSFIRKTLLNKHIPFLNGRLYYYLNELDLPHIVEFGHNLSAKIHKYGHKLEFGNLSNGQKSRVNLALSLSFRDILQKIYGKINILIMDEVLDYGLDSIGVELATKLLKYKSNNEKMSLYVITHRNELISSFDNIITIQMENNFSKIKDAD